MDGIYDRTEKLIGTEAVEKLIHSSVIVFGLGGVGSAVCEGLARAGIGRIGIVDRDVIDETNINRQIIALCSNTGCRKTSEMKKRILDINPRCTVDEYDMFYLPENADCVDLSEYDYVADAIDNVTAKIELAVRAGQAGVRIISSMGTGNKLDPCSFKVADISQTSVCPLARVMRRELRERNITGIKAVYSEELPSGTGNRTPSSISFVPPVAGYIIAGEIIKDLAGIV